MKNIIQEIKDCSSVRINCCLCGAGERVYFIPESIISKLEVVVAKMETTTSEANDCRKAREVLTRVHEFLSNLCKDGRCDTHCSECIGASDLADDVYDVLHTPPRNCERFKTKEEAALAYAKECNAFIPQSILWQIGEWLDWLFAKAKGDAK